MEKLQVVAVAEVVLGSMVPLLKPQNDAELSGLMVPQWAVTEDSGWNCCLALLKESGCYPYGNASAREVVAILKRFSWDCRCGCQA